MCHSAPLAAERQCAFVEVSDSDVLPAPPLYPRSRAACACLYGVVSAYFTDGYYLYANAVTPGPTFGVAVTAWILGTAGAIVCLVYRVRATTEQDGPIKALMQGGANAGQPGVPAVGTV